MTKKNKEKGLAEIDNNKQNKEALYTIQEVRNLTKTTFVLQFNRNGMAFKPGQHLTLGVAGDTQLREYSIYSPNNVDYLEVLIREVEEGVVSKRLKKMQPGMVVNVEGPFGFFTLDEEKLKTYKILFIATGTGIAPFHSMVKSLPDFDYKVLHGIRYGDERYEARDYPEGKYIACTSRDKEGDFHGRVTDYLNQNNVDSNTLVYLCGNYEMIHAVYDILTNKGMSPDNIRTEVYF